MRDGRAADQAGLAGAFVDVRRPGARADTVHQPRVVLGPQRLDLSAAETVLQQVDQVPHSSSQHARVSRWPGNCGSSPWRTSASAR